MGGRCELNDQHMIDDARLGVLAPRQRAVCEAAIRGLTSAQISEELGISPSSVRVTLRRVYELLGVRNLGELRSEFCQRDDAQGEDSSLRETVLLPEATEEVRTHSLFAGKLFLLSAGLLLLLLYFPLGSTSKDPKILDALRFGVPIGLIASCLHMPCSVASRRRRWMAIASCSVSLSSIASGLLLVLSSFALIWTLRIQYTSGDVIPLLAFVSSMLIVSLLCKASAGIVTFSSDHPSFNREDLILFCGLAVLYLFISPCRYLGFAVLALTVIIAVLLAVHPRALKQPSDEGQTCFNDSHGGILSSMRKNGPYALQDCYAFLAFFAVGQLIMCLLDPYQDGMSPLLFLLAGLSLYVPSLIYMRKGVEYFSGIFLFAAVYLIAYCVLGDSLPLYFAALTMGLCILRVHVPSNLSNVLLILTSALGMLYEILLAAFDLHAIPSLDGIYQYGYRALTDLFISFGFSSLFVILLVVIAVAFAFQIVAAKRIEKSVEVFNCPKTTSRLHAYCSFKGLNDFQIDVVDACLLGKSVAETAASLHYSKAAVKAARSVAFQAFGVSNCRGLQNALIAILAQ